MQDSALGEKKKGGGLHLSSSPLPLWAYEHSDTSMEQSPSSHSNLKFQGFYFTQMPPLLALWIIDRLTPMQKDT